jgi:hypothetical protein
MKLYLITLLVNIIIFILSIHINNFHGFRDPLLPNFICIITLAIINKLQTKQSIL